MPKYLVAVQRSCCQTLEVPVEAATASAAEKLAMANASDLDFSGMEKDADYECQYVEEVPDETP